MKPQRFLAAAGFGSRRACEQLILQGRVAINGQVLTFNMDVNDNDDVRVDGRRVSANEELVYIAMNKPPGFISDRGTAHEKSALDLVDIPQRVFAVGRLDKDATGLLLLTNDGELAYRLTHPRFEHQKEYRVLVDGQPGRETLQRWSAGVMLNGEMTAPAQVEKEAVQPHDKAKRHNVADGASADEPDETGTWLKVVLHEGRKRQIKRVAKLLGHPVKALIRVRIGNITLGELAPGQWRRLSAQEVIGMMGESARESQ
ncbi:MAG: rRNA pseudouridine synthase [Chloroflexi bacterium]|nr:rRNA pseudouridine synthase [Chloroflexota bacterium]